ncbi:MAG: hypothetical protein COA85_09760 [Robiginitomaculum sp.]|nr:MAG: hypothetical protein COA85_09760 [Robiginitomaculum sp.]
MMTPQDGFDARLSGAFAKADAQIEPDERFTQRVESRLGKAINPRTIVLGGAGAGGSAIAASQLERLADGLHFQNAALAQIFDTIGGQSLIAIVFALMALSLAFILPGRRI